MNYANPIYDTAFKGLIRDEEIAKEIIGTLLKTEVIDVDLNITEWNKPMTEADGLPRSVRLDYCATILNEAGEKQQILIEVQKTSQPDDILRFRNYLAVAGYGAKPVLKNSPLPIVTFYFLGFKLDNIDTPCLKVARHYEDMMEDRVLETKEAFVELLTHDSYIIQIPRIKNEEQPQTKLAKILSIFEQSQSDDISLYYRFPIEDDYIKKMIGNLQYIILDPIKKQEMDNEVYWYRHDDMLSGELMRKVGELARIEGEIAKKDEELAKQEEEIAKKDEELAKQEEELAKQEEELEKQDEELAKQEVELSKKDEELAKTKKQLHESAQRFKNLGISQEEIAQLTGLSIDEIETL